MLGVGPVHDTSVSYLDPLYDPHCAMSRRDIEQRLSVVPFAAVQDVTSFDSRMVLRALPLDAGALRSFDLESFPERTAAIDMLRGREALMRQAEAVVGGLGLARPQGGGVLDWVPGGHITGPGLMSLRWQLIRREMLMYNTFPWLDLYGVNTGFIRPELYVIEALHLSSWPLGPIFATIRIVAECYPQREPVA